MAKNAVTKATKTDVATTDFEEFASSGLDSLTANDLLVPRLTVLQALSPQLKERRSEYIEGAKEGMIADVGTGELFPDGVLFVPVLFEKVYIEWAPRDSGKGLIEVHRDPSVLENTAKDDKKRNVLPSGNYIAETAQYFGINISGGRQRCYIPMASTQLQKSRQWNTLATREKLKRGDGSEYTAPFFYRAYQLGSAYESNAEGEWYGWTIKRGPALPEMSEEDFGFDWRALKNDCVEFLSMLEEGTAKADTSQMDETKASSSDDEVI